MEQWDLYDENGVVTGKRIARRDAAKIPQGLFHAVAEIWVIANGKILLTQRHPDKSHPLCWECSGGSVLAGETTAAGAVRELGEEVGIHVQEDVLVFCGRDFYPSRRYFCDTFLLRTRVDLAALVLQPTEVVGARLVTLAEAEKMNAAGMLCEAPWARFCTYQAIILNSGADRI
ncbi:MAG: NUDIX domain-containing protein [Oscillospiraceae bacterium]